MPAATEFILPAATAPPFPVAFHVITSATDSDSGMIRLIKKHTQTVWHRIASPFFLIIVSTVLDLNCSVKQLPSKPASN
jgi:hypothetical protein